MRLYITEEEAARKEASYELLIGEDLKMEAALEKQLESEKEFQNKEPRHKKTKKGRREAS